MCYHHKRDNDGCVYQLHIIVIVNVSKVYIGLLGIRRYLGRVYDPPQQPPGTEQLGAVLMRPIRRFAGGRGGLYMKLCVIV